MGKMNPLIALGLNLLVSHLNQGQEQPKEPGNGIPEVADIPPIARLKQKQGAIVTILGARETGKTILSHRIAEVVGRPTYCVSPEQQPPGWIREIKLEEITEKPPPYSTLIMEDATVYASQKDYKDAYIQALERLIPVVRHKRKLIILFNSQSSGLIDKFLLDADLVFFKPLNPLYGDIERPMVARMYKDLVPIFNKMTEAQQMRHAYCINRFWSGLITIQKPLAG